MACACRFLGIILAVVPVVLPLNAMAQQTESRIIGRLLDDSLAALPGVTITVTSKQTGAVRTVVTGGDGAYAITNLGPGTYTVEFDLSGFATQTRDVVLGVGQQETVDITLGVAAVQEAVTVSAEATPGAVVRTCSCAGSRIPSA